ncbi:potassium channel protein [Halobacteriales archaeon QS_8_69_26]|nr:MAG: potassium channel protein [Halobacteriales archaeon QS_8_69_26]
MSVSGVERPIVRDVAPAVGAFLVVVVAGVSGFAVLGDVGLVEATFWIVDLTSVELHFQDHAGPEKATKAFAVLIRVGLVVSGLWIGETLFAAAFGGRIREELETVQTKRRIENLEDHVIVCGYGIFGRTVASRLRDRGVDVVAIELDQGEFERIDRETVPAIQGDARREEVLDEAGVDRARAVVAAIDDSNANIQTAIAASQISPELRVVVRVGDEMYESLARRAGADEVIIPEVVSGERVTESL